MMTSQEGVFKIKRVIFRWQNFIKIERLSQEMFMSESQYQNSTK